MIESKASCTNRVLQQFLYLLTDIDFVSLSRGTKSSGTEGAQIQKLFPKSVNDEARAPPANDGPKLQFCAPVDPDIRRFVTAT